MKIAMSALPAVFLLACHPNLDPCDQEFPPLYSPCGRVADCFSGPFGVYLHLESEVDAGVSERACITTFGCENDVQCIVGVDTNLGSCVPITALGDYEYVLGAASDGRWSGCVHECSLDVDCPSGARCVDSGRPSLRICIY
jgi:hypothetical protein